MGLSKCTPFVLQPRHSYDNLTVPNPILNNFLWDQTTSLQLKTVSDIFLKTQSTILHVQS